MAGQQHTMHLGRRVSEDGACYTFHCRAYGQGIVTNIRSALGLWHNDRAGMTGSCKS